MTGLQIFRLTPQKSHGKERRFVSQPNILYNFVIHVVIMNRLNSN